MFTVLHEGREYAINHIQSAKISKEINDIPELTFTTVNKSNNPAYPYLVEEAILFINDDEWRMKAPTERANYKNIKAVHIGFDLINMPFNATLNGTFTPQNLLSQILSGSDFALQLDATNLSSITVEDFGRMNVWQAFKKACDAFGAEFQFLPGKVIQVKKQLSTDKGQQFRYAYNIKNLAKKTDSTNVATHIIVNFGEDYEKSATFISPTASNYDRAIYGDIINDSRIESFEAARVRAVKEFRDIELSYEIDCIKTAKKYELGEIVHTIYEPLNDLSITTRVLKTTYEWDGAIQEFVLTAVTVGNYTFENEGDIIQGLIESSKNDSDKKLEEARKSINIQFFETDQKIIDQYTTVTAEYTAAININAQQLRSDYNAKFTTVNNNMVTMDQELSSSITQTAQSIRLEVNEKTTQINNSISAQYSNITSEYNSAITQTAQSIRSEVSSAVTSINGEMSDVKRDISSVIQAANEISATVSSHTLEIGGLGTRMTSAESSLVIQAGQISSKVSQTDYNGNVISSLINQTATTVSIKAEKINFEGAVISQGSITGMTSINVGTDLYVGNNIYLGQFNASERKAIRFNSTTSIIGGAGWIHEGIEINCNDLYINADSTYFKNNVDFSGVSSINWGSHAPVARFG